MSEEPELFTVYSKSPCVQCDATYRAFNKAGITRDVDYRVIDVGDPANSEHLEYIKDLGYQQAPVVVFDDDQHWSGYRPDRIKAAVAARQAATPDDPAPPQQAPAAAVPLNERAKALHATIAARSPRDASVIHALPPSLGQSRPAPQM